MFQDTSRCSRRCSASRYLLKARLLHLDHAITWWTQKSFC